MSFFMSTQLAIAQANLLDPAELSLPIIETLVGSLSGKQVDLADLYFQNSRQESWALEDQIVKEGSYHIDGGVGVRVVSGEKTGFSYSSDLSMHSIRQAVSAARSILRVGKNTQRAIKSGSESSDHSLRLHNADPGKSLYSASNPLLGFSETEKVELLRAIDAYVRKKDSRIKEVSVSMVASLDTIVIASLDGVLSTDVRPMLRLSISVLAEENGRRERGSAGGGGRLSLQDLGQWPYHFADEAVRMAQVNLTAQSAPAGTMPIVLGPGWPGVLLHEAVGHGLEGDFNRKGSSAFSGRIGEQVASSKCTVVDDGTLLARRGSLSIDDEGVTPQCTTLIENGILKGYMQDKMNAGLMGETSTGNGRRQSYAHLPMPRMTNTYMLPGNDDPEEIIASLDNGIYAVNVGGGQVDITSGKFVVTASEAYLVKNGKIKHPVKGATLIGNGPEVMQKISMVGNDLKLDPSIGTCGKDGQSVPVGVGQPSLKIDEITVGGAS